MRVPPQQTIDNGSSREHYWNHHISYRLTYWVVYAFFSFVEIFGDFLLFWVPFYYLIKVALLLWLFLPQFKVSFPESTDDIMISLIQGASIVYAKIVRPLLLRYEGNIDE